MFNVLKTFPSSVLWWTKSYDQTWSRYSGRRLTQDPSFNQSRPFPWPAADEQGDTVALTSGQLSMLIEGIDWQAPERTWRPAVAG